MVVSATDMLTQFNFVQYDTLSDKLTALLNGEVLLLSRFEQTTSRDMLAKIDNTYPNYSMITVSYDTHLSPGQTDSDRYWQAYNIGINDLSYATVFLFDQSSYDQTNIFRVGDTVAYLSPSGVKDSAIIMSVYYDTTTSTYAYGVTRETDLFYESELALV